MEDGLRYEDKVIIISGGSRGIGKGCVTLFVSHGSNVVFCSNNESEGREVEKELNCGKYEGKATFIFADVTKEDDVKRLVEKTVELYGKLTMLVGFALPYLRKSEGNIINMSSMSGHHAGAGATTYCASKGAICAMTKALAIDEAKYNVRVNSISPGAIMTPLLCERLGSDDASLQKARDFCVLGRIGTPEEIGKTALFLATDATFCTGIDIECSGGTALNYADKNRRNKPSNQYF